MDSVDSQRAIADLSAAFVADLRALPAEAWSGPSDCAGWSVAALFVHVTQVAELLQDSLARGRSGDPGPPARAAAEGVQGWRAWRAGELARRAAQAPAELLDEYQVSAAQLEREFDAIAAAPPAAQAWHPAGPRPLDWFVAQWLFELALHDWDFRVAADPSADLRAGCQPAFARTLPARLARGFGGADDPALAGRFRIELACEAPLVLLARVGDGRVEAEAADGVAPADFTIQSDPAAFGLVMTNRRPASQFEAAGRWRAFGDAARAAAFAGAFKSY